MINRKKENPVQQKKHQYQLDQKELSRIVCSHLERGFNDLFVFLDSLNDSTKVQSYFLVRTER